MPTNKGVSTILIVLLLMALALLLLAALQSRLLLAIHQGKSVSDSVRAAYASESKLTDLLARVFGGYDIGLVPGNPLDVTENGLHFRIILAQTTSGADTIQTYTITGSLPSASSQIQAVRTIQSTGYDTAEIILSLDCTGSMNATDPGLTHSRLELQRQAAQAFVDEIIAQKALHPGFNFNVGVSIFGTDSTWLKTLDGTNITPDSPSLTLQQISQALTRYSLTNPAGRFTSSRNFSPGCVSGTATNNIYTQNVMDGTNPGAGIFLANTYFSPSPPPRAKRVQILITDGDPTSFGQYTLHPGCTTDFLCPNSSSERTVYCLTPPNPPYGWTCNLTHLDCSSSSSRRAKSRDFFKCQLESIQPADIDTYVVTVGVNPDLDFKAILANPALIKQYFQLQDASNLSSVLTGDILTQILSSTSLITISRQIP